MKTKSIVILALGFMALTTNAQNGTVVPNPPVTQMSSTNIVNHQDVRPVNLPTLTAEKPLPNEIKRNGKTYSGILVQAVKSPKRLQMINPFAPESYGSGDQNVVEDPNTHRATGLKLFAISF